MKIFELTGFAIKRCKGDQIIMAKPVVKRPVVIKTSVREVSVTHSHQSGKCRYKQSFQEDFARRGDKKVWLRLNGLKEQ